MKPTQVTCSEGAVNQIPAWVEMRGKQRLVQYLLFLPLTGDVRLTPFYNVKDCMAKLKGYVDELNKGKLLICWVK